MAKDREYPTIKLADYARSQGISYKRAWRQWKSGSLDGYQLPTGAIFIRVEAANLETCWVCNASLKRARSIFPFSCPICGWVVGSADAKSPIERERLNWARKMWMKCQSSQRSSDRLSDLERKLDALHSQLEGTTQQAREERQYLQSQLDWVLEWLTRVDPDRIGQMLSYLDTIEAGKREDCERYSPSEVGLDYGELQALLAAGRWQDADTTTRSLLLQGMRREPDGWLTPEDIENFPSTDWQTLDWLWYEYSGGRFGFSVQQWIWQEAGGDYAAFCDRVGWRSRDNWLYYEDLRFSLDAPAGHLPVLGWRKRSRYGVGGQTAADILASSAAKSRNGDERMDN